MLRYVWFSHLDLAVSFDRVARLLARSGSLLLIEPVLDHPAALHNELEVVPFLEHGDILQRVALDEEQVRELALFDGADLAFHAEEFRVGLEDRHMVECFRSGERPIETFHDGVDVVEMLMALYRSAETGRTVELPNEDLETYIPPLARGEYRG